MNKISSLAIAALAIGLTGCENFDMPNPPAQTNPQLPAFDAQKVMVNNLLGDGTVNLEEVDAQGDSVVLARVDTLSLPAGYTLAFVAQVGSGESFAKVADVPTAFDESAREIKASPDDLNSAFRSALSTLDPGARTVDIRYQAYAVRNSSKIRLGGENAYYGVSKGTFKPFNPGFVVEEAYYLIGTPTGNVIDADKAVKMSNSGGSPYDDPKFSTLVDITDEQAAEGYYFAIVPQSTLSAGSGTIFAPSENTESAKGTLAETTTPGMWVIIKESNLHLIEFDARSYDYSQSLAIPCLYTPGNSNGWSQSASQTLSTSDYVNYQGYVMIDGEFKFSSAADWDHTNFGAGDAEGTLSTDGGAGNLKADKGLYWVNANIVSLTYNLSVPITTYGVIGDATPGGWNASTALTPSEDMLVWTGTVHLSGEGTFKFRANDGWDINLGGDLADLTPGGDNIATPGEGDYEITLDLSAHPYSAFLQKK